MPRDDIAVDIDVVVDDNIDMTLVVIAQIHSVVCLEFQFVDFCARFTTTMRPEAPFIDTTSPVRKRVVAARTPVIAGSPNSRDTIAPCV